MKYLSENDGTLFKDLSVGMSTMDVEDNNNYYSLL